MMMMMALFCLSKRTPLLTHFLEHTALTAPTTRFSNTSIAWSAAPNPRSKKQPLATHLLCLWRQERTTFLNNSPRTSSSFFFSSSPPPFGRWRRRRGPPGRDRPPSVATDNAGCGPRHLELQIDRPAHSRRPRLVCWFGVLGGRSNAASFAAKVFNVNII